MNTIYITPNNMDIVGEIRRITNVLDIHPSYIELSFRKFKEGTVYFNNNDITAFCIWKIRTRLLPDLRTLKYLHIYLLYDSDSKYNNINKLLYDIELYCINNNIISISLYPIQTGAKEVYIRNAFVTSSTDNQLMVKTVLR
jgi:hypothetical protein